VQAGAAIAITFSKEMKSTRFLIWTFALTIFLIFIAFGVFQAARKSVASEGYDTNEAAWNYLVRRGEVRFRLPDASRITSIDADGRSGSITNSNEAYVPLGYGAFTMNLTYIDKNGVSHSLEVQTQKFNHWNRVLYVQDENGIFTRIDNGVPQDPDTIQKKKENKAEMATPRKPSD